MRGVASILLLELFGFALYFGTLRYSPVWDDHHFVFEQPFLRQCGNLAVVADPRSFYRVLPVVNSARPAWLASVLVDACISGDNIVGYRLSSVFWHVVGAAVLMALAWRLSGSRRVALAAGALFAAQPLHTEAVNIIAFRGELLAFAFGALSLLLFIEARDRDARARRGLQGAALTLFGLALLSKETAATLPLLVFLADRLFPARARVKRWGFYAAMATLVVAYLAFRMPRSGYVMEGHQDLFSELRERVPSFVGAISRPPDRAAPPEPKMEPPPWSEDVFARPKVRLLTMSRVFGTYARLLVWPWPLQGDYAPAPAASWFDGRVWLSWAVWLGLLAAAWKLRRRLPLASLGLVWMPIALLPVSGLIALKNLEAERYLYFPSAGLCLCAAAVMGAALRSRRWAGPAQAAAGALVLLGAARTVERNRDYRSEKEFYAATVAVDPNVPRARFNLAQAWLMEGDYRNAESEFRAALALWPRAIKGRILFSRYLTAAGRTGEARQLLLDTRRLHHGNLLVEDELARLEALYSRIPEARPSPDESRRHPRRRSSPPGS